MHRWSEAAAHADIAAAGARCNDGVQLTRGGKWAIAQTTNALANVACNIVTASANATDNPAQLQAAGAGLSTVASSNMYCLFSFN